MCLRVDASICVEKSVYYEMDMDIDEGSAERVNACERLPYYYAPNYSA